MNLVDRIKKLFREDVIVFAGGYSFNLGREPVTRTGIGGFQKVCDVDGGDQTCFTDIRGTWYNTEGRLLMDGPIITDKKSIKRLNRIVRR